MSKSHKPILFTIERRKQIKSNQIKMYQLNKNVGLFSISLQEQVSKNFGQGHVYIRVVSLLQLTTLRKCLVTEETSCCFPVFPQSF